MPQVGPRSLYFDVTGDARTEKIKLPSCIKSSKPGALPNTQVRTPPSPPPNPSPALSFLGKEGRKEGRSSVTSWHHNVW